MLACVRQSVEECDGPTARILFDFARNMSAPGCAAQMEVWAKEEQQQQHHHHQATGAAPALVTLSWPAHLMLPPLLAASGWLLRGMGD